MREIAEREGISLDESYAYSDSMTDLPLLELVGNPHAVNPDRELKAIAEERGWPVLEFRRQVSLAKRLARPVPIISGATVATVIGAAIAWTMVRKRRR